MNLPIAGAKGDSERPISFIFVNGEAVAWCMEGSIQQMHCDRKHERKDVSYPAWIFIDGSEPRVCVIEDASDGGARLQTEHPERVPDRFRLGFSLAANKFRNCVVIWRKTGRIGVRFSKHGEQKSSCAKVI